MEHLTELESIVLTEICKQLKMWRDDEPDYSCIDHSDLKTTGLPKRTIAGVLGTLTQKNIIQIDEGDDFGGIIYPNWKNIDNDFGR